MLNFKPMLILAVALILSLVGNAWQFRINARAKLNCELKLSELRVQALQDSIARDTAAIEIATDATADAESADAEISQNTNEATTRVRTIIREVPVPTDCPVSLPSRVQDEINAATARANRVM